MIASIYEGESRVTATYDGRPPALTRYPRRYWLGVYLFVPGLLWRPPRSAEQAKHLWRDSGNEDAVGRRPASPAAAAVFHDPASP
jgi:hypothetical protein